MNISQEILNEIKEFFRQDKILILPTDTVFGLICSAYSVVAVQNLFDLKKRDKNKSFSIFCQKNQIQDFAHLEHAWQERIIENFLPGQITLVLKTKDQRLIDSKVSQNGKIGIRIPSQDFWARLLSILDFPLAATSVNFSGEKPACSFEEIDSEILSNKNVISKNYFSDQTNLFSSNKPSSVFDISLSKDPLSIKVLREGVISKEEILKKL